MGWARCRICILVTCICAFSRRRVSPTALIGLRYDAITPPSASCSGHSDAHWPSQRHKDPLVSWFRWLSAYVRIGIRRCRVPLFGALESAFVDYCRDAGMVPILSHSKVHKHNRCSFRLVYYTIFSPSWIMTYSDFRASDLCQLHSSQRHYHHRYSL
jgi:hypothetical protein